MQHIKLITAEIETVFIHFCQPSDPLALHATFASGDVQVPSCAALRDAGIETYYGNLNMLLVEAWLGKILPSLQAVESGARPSAELLKLQADGVLGGAIFVQQLRLPTGAAAPAAMMLGIHRLPRHKAMRQMLGRAPGVVVTDARCEDAAWACLCQTTDISLSSLYWKTTSRHFFSHCS